MTEFGIYKQVNTAFRHTGEGQDVILLHGWGQNMEMMEKIEDHLSTSFSVYNLDFPGFGESDNPPVSWGVPDYVEFLEDFICLKTFQEHNMNDSIIIRQLSGLKLNKHKYWDLSMNYTMFFHTLLLPLPPSTTDLRNT